MATARGAAAREAGVFGAGTTILGGVADIGFKSYEMGMWGKKKPTKTVGYGSK